jgi:hypothetical protein
VYQNKLTSENSSIYFGKSAEDLNRRLGFVYKIQGRRFGVAIEAKKCLHFFVNERRRL